MTATELQPGGVTILAHPDPTLVGAHIELSGTDAHRVQLAPDPWVEVSFHEGVYSIHRGRPDDRPVWVGPQILAPDAQIEARAGDVVSTTSTLLLLGSGDRSAQRREVERSGASTIDESPPSALLLPGASLGRGPTDPSLRTIAERPSRGPGFLHLRLGARRVATPGGPDAGPALRPVVLPLGDERRIIIEPRALADEDVRHRESVPSVMLARSIVRALMVQVFALHDPSAVRCTIVHDGFGKSQLEIGLPLIGQHWCPHRPVSEILAMVHAARQDRAHLPDSRPLRHNILILDRNEPWCRRDSKGSNPRGTPPELYRELLAAAASAPHTTVIVIAEVGTSGSPGFGDDLRLLVDGTAPRLTLRRAGVELAVDYPEWTGPRASEQRAYPRVAAASGNESKPAELFIGHRLVDGKTRDERHLSVGAGEHLLLLGNTNAGKTVALRRWVWSAEKEPGLHDVAFILAGLKASDDFSAFSGLRNVDEVVDFGHGAERTVRRLVTGLTSEIQRRLDETGSHRTTLVVVLDDVLSLLSRIDGSQTFGAEDQQTRLFALAVRCLQAGRHLGIQLVASGQTRPTWMDGELRSQFEQLLLFDTDDTALVREENPDGFNIQESGGAVIRRSSERTGIKVSTADDELAKHPPRTTPQVAFLGATIPAQGMRPFQDSAPGGPALIGYREGRSGGAWELDVTSPDLFIIRAPRHEAARLAATIREAAGRVSDPPEIVDPVGPDDGLEGQGRVEPFNAQHQARIEQLDLEGSDTSALLICEPPRRLDPTQRADGSVDEGQLAEQRATQEFNRLVAKAKAREGSLCLIVIAETDDALGFPAAAEHLIESDPTNIGIEESKDPWWIDHRGGEATPCAAAELDGNDGTDGGGPS